jgi:hypothetical protein
MMQNKIVIFISFFLFIYFNNEVYSQLTNKWNILDSSKIEYPASGKNIDFIDENDIVIFGNTNLNSSSSNINNKYFILSLQNSCQNIKKIYYDSINTKDEFNAIKHPLKNVIIIVGNTVELLGNYNGNKYKYSNLIIKTTNSGISWERTINDSNEIYFDLSMCDSNIGIISKTNVPNFFNPNIGDKIYSLIYTNDCWKSFKEIAIPDSNNTIKKIYCLTKNKWILILSDNKKNNKYYLLLTNNSGQTWQKSNLFDNNVRINDIHFFNEEKVLAIGSRKLTKTGPSIPLILRSTNSGLNWYETHNFYFEGLKKFISLEHIKFLDSLNGIVSAQNTIFRTTDGGDSWIEEDVVPERYFDDSNYWITNISYPSNNLELTCLGKDFILINNSNKVLIKPKFYPILNYYFLPYKQLEITWNIVNGATSYRLKMDGFSKDSSDLPQRYNFEKSKIDTIISDNSISLHSLDSNFRYKVWVKAIGNNSQSEWSIPLFIGTLKNESSVAPPFLLEPMNNDILSPGEIKFVWTKVNNPQNYILKIYNDLENKLVFQLENLVDTNITLETFEPSTRYFANIFSVIDDTTLSESYNYFFYTWYEPLFINDNTLIEPKNLFLYPNPVNDEINITIPLNDFSIVDVNIYNILGQKVLCEENKNFQDGNPLRILTENLSTGFYYIEVSVNKNSHRGMFIKQ